MNLLTLFLTFLQIGAFSFGGGYASLPLIELEIITKRNWLTHETFAELLAIVEMTPGPIAVNTATFIGFKVGGVGGAALATLGVVTVPVILMLILATIAFRFLKTPLVQDLMNGLRPGIVALILYSALSIGKVALTGWGPVIISLVGLAILARTKLHPAWLLVAAAFGGILFL